MMLSVLPMAIFAEGNSGDIILPPDCFHSRLSYTNNGADHTVSCADCDYSATEAHTFVNGTCVCGATDAIPEAYNSELTLKSVNIDLASAIAINFNGLASIFSKYTDVYVEYTAEGKEPVKVYSYFTSSSGSDLRWNYAYEGLTALDLDLDIYATVYGMKDGVLYHGDTKTYSILKYSTSAMSKGNNDAIPCANLLKYGNAAQLFKNVPASEAVLSKLDATQTAQLEQYAYPDSAVNVAKTSVVSQGTLVKFQSQNVDMLSRITLVYKINFANYSGDRNNVTFKVRYTDAFGVEQEKDYAFSDLTDAGGNIYELYFAEFYSTQLREIATCEIYIDGVLHASYGNSVENYCYTTLNSSSNSAAMKYLATRMSLYGDASYEAYANR